MCSKSIWDSEITKFVIFQERDRLQQFNRLRGQQRQDRLEQGRNRAARNRQARDEDRMERALAEARQIEDEHMAAMDLVENGNQRGPLINYLTEVRGFFGSFWSNNQDGCRKFCLQLAMSLFSQYDIRPVGQLPDDFNDIYYLICGLLRHKNSGGNFLDGTWRQTYQDVCQTKDPSADPEIFRPLEDRKLIAPQNHVYELNENVTPEFYKTILSSIAYNVQNMDKFILRNLTKIVYLGHHDDSYENADVNHIEDPNGGDCKYMEYMQSILESLQKALKDEIICFSCVQGLPNHDQAVRHLDKFHGMVDKLEVARVHDQRTNILLQKEKEKIARLEEELTQARAEIARLRNGELN